MKHGLDPEENPIHLLHPLSATGIKIGLLVNFGRTKAERKRLVF